MQVNISFSSHVKERSFTYLFLGYAIPDTRAGAIDLLYLLYLRVNGPELGFKTRSMRSALSSLRSQNLVVQDFSLLRLVLQSHTRLVSVEFAFLQCAKLGMQMFMHNAGASGVYALSM